MVGIVTELGPAESYEPLKGMEAEKKCLQGRKGQRVADGDQSKNWRAGQLLHQIDVRGTWAYRI